MPEPAENAISALALPPGRLGALRKRLLASALVRKLVETFAVRLLLIGVSLLTSALLARALGPQGRGVFAIASAMGALGLQFGNLGLHSSNTYTVAREPHRLPGLIANSLWVSFVFGTFLALATQGVVMLWPGLANIPTYALFLAVVGIPFLLANMLLQNLFIGLDRIRVVNQFDVATKICLALLTFVLIVFRAVSVGSVLLLNALLVVAGFVWLIRRILPLVENHPLKYSNALFRENLRYGFKAYLAALFMFMVLRADIFLVQHYLGFRAVGNYSLAVTIADMVMLFPTILGTLLFPRLSAMTNETERKAFMQKALVGIGAIIAVVVVLLGFSARWLVPLVYGTDYLGAVPALVWLLPGILALALNTILMNYFASQGMPLFAVLSPFAAMVTNILLNLKLIPLFGIVGASLSSSIAYGMMLAASLLYLTLQKQKTTA